MVTKLGKALTYGKAKPIVKSHNSDRMITRGYVSNRKLNVSSCTRSIPSDLTRW